MYKSGYLTEADADIECQMTAAEDNVLRAIIRKNSHVLRHVFPHENGLLTTYAPESINLLYL